MRLFLLMVNFQKVAIRKFAFHVNWGLVFEEKNCFSGKKFSFKSRHLFGKLVSF